MAGQKGYIYTNGVIASISKKLIDKDTFDKIIDASVVQNAVTIFNNTHYVSGKKVNSIYDIGKVLDAEEVNLSNFLKRECPSQVFIDYIDCYNDYENLETVYKSNLFKLNLEEKNITGSLSFQKIKDILSRNEFNDFENEFVREMFRNINLIKDKKSHWSKIDFYFKKYRYKNLFDIVKKDKILLSILKYKVDLQNLGLAFRTINFDELKAQFIESGNLNLKFFKTFINENRLILTSNDKILENFIKIAKKSSDNNEKLRIFEQENKLLELKVLSKYENKIESIIPFLKYYYRKKLEITNLKMIFSLKLNNLSGYIKDRFLEEN